MAKEYVPIFFDWLDTTQDLSQEEKGNLIDAVVSYAAGYEYEHLLTGGCRIAFRFLKGQVDRTTAISAARPKAGSNKREQEETKPIKPDQNESNQNKKQEKEQLEKMFDRFWMVYPRKVAKETARKAFVKLKPDELLLQTMMAAVERQKKSEQWMKDNGQFIPHPATWLNNRRWDDEIAPAAKEKVLPAADFDQRDYTGVNEELIHNLDREMKEFMAGGAG